MERTDQIVELISKATIGTNKISGYFILFEVGSGIPYLFIVSGSFVFQQKKFFSEHWALITGPQ